jgi:hypothetical protein
LEIVMPKNRAKRSAQPVAAKRKPASPDQGKLLVNPKAAKVPPRGPGRAPTNAQPKTATNAKDATGAKRGAKGAKTAAEPKRLSALDAAAKILADSKEPMRSGDLVTQMEKKGLWTSKAGKTPAATIYAGIIREISAKGKDSRFKKHERGVFVAAK